MRDPYETELMKRVMIAVRSNLSVTEEGGISEILQNKPYSSRVFESANQLLNVCEQMELAINRIGNAHLTKGYRVSILNYEVENFLFRVGMTIDRALKLINSVYDLGIPPKECKMRAISRNAHVADDIGRCVRELDTLVRPQKTDRNQIAHSSSFEDSRLVWLAAVDNIHRFHESKAASDGESVTELESAIGHHATLFVEEKTSEFDAIRIRVCDKIAELLDGLAPTYCRKASTLEAA